MLGITQIEFFNTVIKMNPEIKKKIIASKTNLFKAVFPELTNHHNIMHGGKAMLLMDEIAFLTATRFSRKSFVTASSNVNYKKPLPADSIIEVIGEVVKIGNTSLDVGVKIFVEKMFTNSRFEAVDALFTLVAVDENKNPISV